MQGLPNVGDVGYLRKSELDASDAKKRFDSRVELILLFPSILEIKCTRGKKKKEEFLWIFLLLKLSKILNPLFPLTLCIFSVPRDPQETPISSAKVFSKRVQRMQCLRTSKITTHS